MLTLHLIEVVSKPLTLAFRLYGNIYAGEIMISVIMGAGWLGLCLYSYGRASVCLSALFKPSYSRC